MSQTSGGMQNTQQVACMCWFPVGQKPYPYLLKVKDHEGDIHTIRDIDILDTREVFQGLEFTCEAAIMDRKQRFSLMYFKDGHRWLMTLRG